MKEWYLKKSKEFYQRYQQALDEGDEPLAIHLFNEYERYTKEAEKSRE